VGQDRPAARDMNTLDLRIWQTYKNGKVPYTPSKYGGDANGQEQEDLNTDGHGSNF